MKEKAIRTAAQKMEVAEEDLRLVDGRVELVGAPGLNMTLGAIAPGLTPGNTGIAQGRRPWPTSPTRRSLGHRLYSSRAQRHRGVLAVHAAEVAVDEDTGQITVERYLVAADVGRAINPMIVEGQLVGGVVQGLGGTLLEEITYGDDGQLQTGLVCRLHAAVGQRSAADQGLGDRERAPVTRTRSASKVWARSVRQA